MFCFLIFKYYIWLLLRSTKQIYFILSKILTLLFTKDFVGDLYN